MAIAPFFERIYGAVGLHLAVSRKSLTKTLQNTVVGICCGEDLSHCERDIAELVVNICARLYPTIEISGPALETERLIELARAINPDVEFAVDTIAHESVCIGLVSRANAIYPSSSGWVVRLEHKGPRTSGPYNPYAAAASATFACSELFRRVFLGSHPEDDISISLLDFSSSAGHDLELMEGTIGDVLFVGVGAVGNAALWALSRDTTISGTLHVIDQETLALSNLQRYVLGTIADVSRVKVTLAVEAMKNSRISVHPYQSTIEWFTPPTDWVQPETTCISIDNVEGRRVAQALLPRLIVNGWTGERALGASWHRFSSTKACLACLYFPHGIGVSAIQQAAKAFGLAEERAALLWITRKSLSDDERDHAAKLLGVKSSVLKQWKDKPLADIYTDVVCGAVPLDLKSAGRVEVVPLAHQSVLAGILLAAELVKRTNASLEKLAQAETLVTWEDVLRHLPNNWARPRPRERGCICSDSIYQSVYEGKWGIA